MVESFTVDRRRWQRGEEEGYLYGSNRKMCCLGFLARACGLGVREIRGKELPSDCDMASEVFSDSLISEEESIAAANDSLGLSERKRERELRARFKAIGVTVKFIN